MAEEKKWYLGALELGEWLKSPDCKSGLYGYSNEQP